MREDLDFDINENDGKINENCECIKCNCPKMQVKIGENKIKCICDTGSQITCISEEFEEKIDKKIKECLPISNIVIRGAFKARTVRVKKQISTTLEVGPLKLKTIFLVVPNLTSDMILGSNWFKENKVIIDYKNSKISINDVVFSEPIAKFEEFRERVDDECRRIDKENREFDINAKIKALKKNSIIKKIIDENNNFNMTEIIECEIENTEIVKKVEKMITENENLNEIEKDALLYVILKNIKVFSGKPGRAKNYEHKINVKDSKAIIRKNYPIPITKLEKVRNRIKELKRENILEDSDSPHCNPLRIVEKKDGAIRVCIDGRFVNVVIESEHEGPPNIDDILQKHEGKKFFSTTDFPLGYYQIPLEKNSRKYTAFVFEGKSYQFTRVPFGLKTAGNGFVRAVNKALEGGTEEFTTAYVDDILITSADFSSHLMSLDATFKKLIEAGFTLNIEKSNWCRSEVKFLGFKLTKEGIEIDPEKIKAINDIPEPKSLKQLQSALGVFGQFRRFTFKYANYIEPFREILSAKKKFKWTEEHSRAFKEMKRKFIENTTLAHYRIDKQFILRTDASKKGIAAMLVQKDASDNECIISIVSRCVKNYEKNYTITELELLAIVYGVVKFAKYLLGSTFKIITDHQALTFFLKTPFYNSRLARWSMILSEHSFEIEYCRGERNIAADYFSRVISGSIDDDDDSTFVIAKNKCMWENCKNKQNESQILNIKTSNRETELKNFLKNIKQEQREDTKTNQIINKVNNKSMGEGFCIHEGVLFFKSKYDLEWRIVVPHTISEIIVETSHERLGHQGFQKTLKFIQKHYFWKGLRKQVKKFIKICDNCQRTKHLNICMEGKFKPILPEGPGEILSVDFFGPLPKSRGGVKYVFVLKDLFSKLITLYPIKRANTKTCLQKLLEDYFIKVGKPKKIISDHGTQFTAKAWQNTLEREGVKVGFSSIRHPKSNPVERTMRELGRFFRTYCSENHTSWATKIKDIEKYLNIATHESTGFPPHELHFGESIKGELESMVSFPPGELRPREVQLKLAKKSMLKLAKIREKQQGKISKIKLNEGDLVLLREPHLSNALEKEIHKFFHIYIGPFIINKKIGENAFEIIDKNNKNRKKGVYNRTELRKYFEK